MRVLSIDPGLASCGWCLLRFGARKPFCEASGVWKTEPHPDAPKRIAELGMLFANMLHGVELVVLEAWGFQGAARSHHQAVGVRHKRDVKRAVSLIVDHEHAVPNAHAADAIAAGIAGERMWRVGQAERRSA
jgi:Holliday junction resolvasome RuvABC endonuclease subunit